MSSDAIFKEIKDALGIVPGFFKLLPAETLVAEWELFKKFTLDTESPIPLKYRELIGAAVAAAHKCFYCSTFHGALARFHGATEDEVNDAIWLATQGAHWSALLNGQRYSHEQFVKEVEEVGKFLNRQ